MTQPRKALALISGGLDSMLAARLMMEQGIHVEGVNFYTGFCVEGHTQAIRQSDTPKRNNALWVAEQLGIKLHIVDVSEIYKDVVTQPKYGYGAQMNPCLDCKIFMLSQAKKMMEEEGFDCVITGEVVGQRPMSQRSHTMPIVAQESGLEDRLVRPLCAHKLPPTLPEREGWVDRQRLMGLHGRSRKPQMELARRFGIQAYAQPAGGCCFLTDPNYTKKLKDLWDARGAKQYEIDDIVLLKVGRHFRMKPYFKLIMAREEGENQYLSGYQSSYLFVESTSHVGPVAIVDGHPEPGDFEDIARLLARYCRKQEGVSQVTVRFSLKQEVMAESRVAPFALEEIPVEWLL